MLEWEEQGIQTASAILGSSVRYLTGIWIVSAPLRSEPLGMSLLVSVCFFTGDLIFETVA